VIPIVVLVVARAPVPGAAKKRLAAGVGEQAAADIAAAALLDTLDAVLAAPVEARVVALTGDMHAASNSDEIHTLLADFTVVPQRGRGLAERLANAHLDAAAAFTGLPVLQIGMDTPQVTAGLLGDCARELLACDAVLGPARDGGWWVLGVTNPAMADCLRFIPTSRSDTGVVTLTALRDTGVEVGLVPVLSDVDTADDIDAVRRECAPGSRFTRATVAAGV
jgi:glycosyltransferase A (GT-A) superfamily protein (DUF2064 family)